MSLKLGSTAINKLWLGSTEIKRAYLGATEIFDSTAVSGPQAVTFDGSTTYLALDAAHGGTDTQEFTAYIKFSTTYATTPFRRLVNFSNSGQSRVHFVLRNDGSLSLQLTNDSNTRILEVETSAGYNDGSPHELMLSYDGVAGTSQVYMDGVSDKASTVTETTGTIGLTTNNNNRIAAQFNNGNLFPGDFWRVTLWDDVAADLSNAAVRSDVANHIAATSVGTNFIDYWGTPAEWNAGTNKGSGNDFTMVGAVT